MPENRHPLPSALDLQKESIVISGPPMSGKYELWHRLLGTEADRSLVISTGHPADRVRDDYITLSGHSGDSIGIVDCVSREQQRDVADDEFTKYASSPKNLTDIGVKFTELIETMRGEEVAVGVHSLSQLLMYWDVDRIYQFTRVLLGQARSEGWPTIAVINSTMHEERVLHTLLDPFEAVIDTRTTDTDRELRVRDRTGLPGEWERF
ncbi:DUF7504 family protein [Natronocalculus amylovorans]|uniref:Recombinase RecA n=1 Tax=Natronocalculus amylovorans TaxID=2917812 RepID=A0AAE3FV04_9EURY|nr:hypothetical protein [Natronocalculus amylovorans]MCL9816112.1 hypothetical protein [Natronocalculus amylovorans]